jgi:hypothetical protein
MNDADPLVTSELGTAVSQPATVGLQAGCINDPDATHEVSRKLRCAEKLLWAGRPFQGWRLYSVDSVLLPITLLWSIVALATFAVGIETLTAYLRGLADPINPEIGRRTELLFAIVFVTLVPASAFHLACGRFMLDTRRRARTWYGLTTERILIVRGVTPRKVIDIPLHDLGHITFSQRADGSGTICFVSCAATRPARFRVAGAGSRFQLERIPQVRRVVRRLTSAQRKI